MFATPVAEVPLTDIAVDAFRRLRMLFAQRKKPRFGGNVMHMAVFGISLVLRHCFSASPAG